MKTFILRVTPYVITLIAGMVIYYYAEYVIEDEGMNGLLVGVASGLVSVPLVFICYEVVSEICNNRLKKTLLAHLVFEINYVIIDIIREMKDVLGYKPELSKDNINEFLDMDKKDIGKRLKIDPKDAEMLKTQKVHLSNILYKDSNMDVLPNEQIRTVLKIVKELGVAAKELEFYKKTKKRTVIDNAAYTLMQALGDWVDYVDEDAIFEHHSFGLEG